jgi:hypothetical protein
MRVEFLGTGGAVIMPRPLCSCGICVQARERDVPYARSEPGVFVRGPGVLIDTPEEIKGGKRLLIAPDEINGWVPPDWLSGADLAIPQVSVFEFHRITRGRRIQEKNPVLKAESTFEQTLQIVDSLDAQRTMLTHI